MKPITVCIPTYNGAKYLRECLDSVIQQDFPNFQILVVDDCSSDNTPSIVREYMEKDNRITLKINEKNLGLVENWNECIKSSKTDWVKFLFQDDIMKPNCLSRMAEVASETNSDFIVCDRNFIIEPSASFGLSNFYSKDISKLSNLIGKTTKLSAKEFLKFFVESPFDNFVGEPITFLFNKSIVEKYGLFNRHISQLCDYEYIVRVAINEGMSFINEPLVNFRVHGSSTSESNHTNNKEKIEVIDNFLLAHIYCFDNQYSTLQKNYKNKFLNLYSSLSFPLFASGVKNFYSFLHPYFSSYPSLIFSFLKYRIQTFFNHDPYRIRNNS